jgi:hypothetical protein
VSQIVDVQERLNGVRGVVALMEYVALHEQIAAVDRPKLHERSAEWFWQGVFIQAHQAQLTLLAIQDALPLNALSLPAPVEGGE